MTNKLLCTIFTAGLGILAAAPQTAVDGPGVTVDLGSSTVMHRTSVSYNGEAIRAKVEGAVVAEVTLDGAGNVTDARILSGPIELHRAVLSSVLQWHFTNDSGATTRQVRVNFQTPAMTPTLQAPTGAVSASRGVISGVITGVPSAPSLNGKIVSGIQFGGLSDQAQNKLKARLPMQQGDTVSDDAFERTVKAAREFDEHIVVRLLPLQDNSALLMIISPGGSIASDPLLRSAPAGPGRITVGGNVQSARLTSQAKPVYPAEAKEARISGTVKLTVIIARDGSVADIKVISGHPLFISPAIDAVKLWQYQPTLLNGEPVEVSTQVDVNFTLSQ